MSSGGTHRFHGLHIPPPALYEESDQVKGGDGVGGVGSEHARPVKRKRELKNFPCPFYKNYHSKHKHLRPRRFPRFPTLARLK